MIQFDHMRPRSVFLSSQNWADATVVFQPDCSGCQRTVVSAMPNERESDFTPERNEAESEPNIHERVEALKEKVSGLTDMLGDVEKTLEEAS